MTHLLFATALALSACAAYYSVMGLVAIFASAVIPIFIMGSLLEASKLVVASWLYHNWKQVPVLLKSYFTVALVILMMLTSMGIFGYLSKAHLDQAIPTGDVAAKLSLIDEKIKTEKDNLNANRKELNQLDAQVDQTISRTTEASGAERAIAIRKGQQKDRNRILNEIGTTQAKIAKLNEERAPIASEVRKVEAEVGPIKYIAALIYEDNPSEDVLEKAVRWVIIMIVSVFDPLAVLLLIAANWNMKREKENAGLEVFAGKADVKIDEGELPPVSDYAGFVAQEVAHVVPEAVVVEPPEKPSKWNEIFDKVSFQKAEPLPEETQEVINDFFSPKQQAKIETYHAGDNGIADTKHLIEPTSEVIEVNDVIKIDINPIEEKPPRMPLR